MYLDDITFKVSQSRSVGALTALKVAKRMEARINCRTGLALEIRGGNILVNFEGDVILVHIMFLEVINEKR